MDFAAKALEKARAKAAAQRVRIDFVQADATRLSSVRLANAPALIVDFGCLHGMSDDTRDRNVQQLSVVAAPQAQLLIYAADESETAADGQPPERHYLLQRRQ